MPPNFGTDECLCLAGAFRHYASSPYIEEFLCCLNLSNHIFNVCELCLAFYNIDSEVSEGAAFPGD